MRTGGFSLLEVMVVVCVVGISGAMAVFAMSDQVIAAKSRSDEIGMFLRIKAERNNARERMRGLTMIADNGGHTVVFGKPIITRSNGSITCTTTPEVIGSVHFTEAVALIDSSNHCLDENGRPVGTFTMGIKGRDGRVNTVSVTESGQLVSELNERTSKGEETSVVNFSEASMQGQ